MSFFNCGESSEFNFKKLKYDRPIVKMSAGGKKTKGLSFEEKRKRMCDFFYEKRDFFQLKELEKMLPKEKGIVAQTVKDVVQSLVDDRLVTAEKIGTSNYFWSFPSTALQTRQVKIDAMKQEMERLRQVDIDLTKQIAQAAMSRPDNAERREMLERLKELEGQMSERNAELEKFKDLDPALFEEKKKAMMEAKAATDRWTDNIFTLQTYCANNFGISSSDFAVQFGIAEDFDYAA